MASYLRWLDQCGFNQAHLCTPRLYDSDQQNSYQCCIRAPRQQDSCQTKPLLPNFVCISLTYKIETKLKIDN